MATKSFTMPIPRSIKADMRERFIFNFKMRPEELSKRLPVPWLEPQTVDGWSIVSFCILSLDKLTVSPIPAIFPFHTLSCAYRIGVIDTSGGEPEPSVYITDRYADLPLISKLAPIIMLDTIPTIKAAVGHVGDETHAQMSFPDGQHIFSAEMRPQEGGLQSGVFDSIDDFARFIKQGVTSYAPSLYQNKYAKVDLIKEDKRYDPLEGEIEHSALSVSWVDADLQFDSAVRATGDLYKWTYRGLYSA